jgi:hypothetical protein
MRKSKHPQRLMQFHYKTMAEWWVITALNYMHRSSANCRSTEGTQHVTLLWCQQGEKWWTTLRIQKSKDLSLMIYFPAFKLRQ